MFAGRDQTFNQHHFRILSVGVVVGDDLFHQHVFLIAGEQRLNVAHLQRFCGRKVGVRANNSGSLVWRIATGTRLSDRFKDAQTNAFTFHSTDNTEADAGQAYAGSGRDQHDCTGHDISSFVTASIRRDTKLHHQLPVILQVACALALLAHPSYVLLVRSWGFSASPPSCNSNYLGLWLAVWNQAVRRLASCAMTSSSLVGMTIAGRVPSLLMKPDLPKRAARLRS